MSTQRLVFESAKMVFGLGHFVFSTAAELCLEGEVAVTKKTGYYNNGQMHKLDSDIKVMAYKDARRDKSQEMRDNIVKVTRENWKSVIEARRRANLKAV